MENKGPFVPPEAGPELFRRMREAADSGNSSAEQLKVEKPPQAAVQKIKGAEKVTKNTLSGKGPLDFKTGASAMDKWQKEQEVSEEKRWHNAA